ncbi:Glycerol uptake/efflux facilitator protein [Wickerhamomyces ciferrii]|uniref:Glycerol uptake/efflux facilitator protein n=1 Tax=Wickerhamomyces ciferrii (strain ATCC 14091 / BCRC 22168 / CBS 111 / JCM 3599 / NBRC 0793 / NRRL Y-1031 F-60-10) TaxID=1206466 RepID=K0KS58_WICCF|nr:Glycerol uptake/efflux facilitator protein [Wickerhamomyces ciferrii]CCH44822.1 Glycerol uptake/efflux facilitator protein [Wickerhamomyces ciferrii]
MSMGSKPEVFHSDDITSEYLEETLPGRPVDLKCLRGASYNQGQRHPQPYDHFNNNYLNSNELPNSSSTAYSSSTPPFKLTSQQDLNFNNLPNVAPTSGLERAATNNSKIEPHLYTRWQKIRHAFREPFAEFLGTMILVMFGDGVVAQKVLSKGEAGNYTTIALSWATAVFLGYTVSAGISGAHLNPGVTLSSAVFRKFPWRKVPGYVFAQTFGGYIGGLLVYATYVQSINEFEGGVGIRTVGGETSSAGLFCTFSQPYLSTGGQVVSELVSSALLQLGIFAMTDPYNNPLGQSFPFGLFLLIYGIGSSFGYQTGYAINLARDFAPRLAAATVGGYGSDLFTAGNYYFWVPLVIPLIGCLLGGLIYDVLIYQGHDSPLNRADFGMHEQSEHIRQFKLKDMKPDFNVEAHAQKEGGPGFVGNIV